MNIGIRSRLSLCQLLDAVLNRDDCVVMLKKYSVPTDGLEGYQMGTLLAALSDAILQAPSSKVSALAQEMARTRQSVRHGVSPKHLFDERWHDFTLSMTLDGNALAVDDYGTALGSFLPIEPVIEGSEPLEDDLTRELSHSELADKEEILRLIEESAKDFIGGNNNGCLNNARVALETTARAIAGTVSLSRPLATQKWSEALTALREGAFISVDQEKGLAGVYRFISPGSHVPVGFTESEFARLGRTLALSTIYFIVKEWNGFRNNDR